MSLGFIVGKFYPPHRGHKHLIDVARRQVDHLVVMIAHHISQKIPGAHRRDWLKQIHPDCDIRLVPDELAEDPGEWARFTIGYLGRAPDVVFTSESYGEQFARHLGCRHVLVDQPRSAVPCSGTLIRSAPLEYLHFLEPCVRQYIVRRVVLVGAESTGKTTLASLLARTYQTTWVAEYGREHWIEKLAGHTVHDPPPAWTPDEFIHIARTQQSRENEMASVANRILVCDTNAFATGLWFKRYMGTRHPEVDAIGRNDTAHLYLLCEPDIPFVQDGYRDGEFIRHAMHDEFVSLLDKTGVPVLRLRGNIDTRHSAARAAIDSLIANYRIG